MALLVWCNSTVFNNTGGYVANIREGMVLNNVTMIRNDAGLHLKHLNGSLQPQQQVKMMRKKKQILI